LGSGLDRRRAAAALLSIGGLVLCRVAPAQERVRRIGALYGGMPVATARLREAFMQGLRDLGYVEGRNILIEQRYAENNFGRLNAMAKELVAMRVELIFASPTGAVIAAKQATTTIPIVFPVAADPVSNGLVSSLAHPGGNATGISLFSPDLAAKRLQLLRELLPKLSTIAAVGATSVSANQLAALERAAKGLEMQVLSFAWDESNPEDSIRKMRGRKVGAIYLIETPSNYAKRDTVAEITIKNRFPLMGGDRAYVESGALISYGPDYRNNYRHAAVYVDRILRGAKPGDLPVEQPTSFELLINLKTAKLLQITVPKQVLARVDEVIQ
jgi:putative tryptophan/tyrosine transport system substrate-binding protein